MEDNPRAKLSYGYNNQTLWEAYPGTLAASSGLHGVPAYAPGAAKDDDAKTAALQERTSRLMNEG